MSDGKQQQADEWTHPGRVFPTSIAALVNHREKPSRESYYARYEMLSSSFQKYCGLKRPEATRTEYTDQYISETM